MSQVVRAKLEITVTADGAVRVDGPIQDMTLCYGLLEVAKDTIRTYHAQTRLQQASIADVISLSKQ